MCDSVNVWFEKTIFVLRLSLHLESGVGVIAGRGRESVVVGGKPRALPFLRQTGGENEDLLSEIVHGVAYAIRHAAPEHVTYRHDLQLQQAFQYPRQVREGAPFLKSHQAAIRAHGGETKPHGSDLHVDTMDGTGGWTIYAGEAPSAFDHLAVFEGAKGGAGFQVRVGGLGPEWVCAVTFDTAARLHGSVWPGASSQTVESPAPGSGLRVVTYPMRKVELLEAAVQDEPGEESHVLDACSGRLRSRSLGRWDSP